MAYNDYGKSTPMPPVVSRDSQHHQSVPTVKKRLKWNDISEGMLFDSGIPSSQARTISINDRDLLKRSIWIAFWQCLFIRNVSSPLISISTIQKRTKGSSETRPRRRTSSLQRILSLLLSLQGEFQTKLIDKLALIGMELFVHALLLYALGCFFR